MPVVQVKRFRGTKFFRAIATGFGAGSAPVAPGTFGSLLALPLWRWGVAGVYANFSCRGIAWLTG